MHSWNFSNVSFVGQNIPRKKKRKTIIAKEDITTCDRVALWKFQSSFILYCLVKDNILVNTGLFCAIKHTGIRSDGIVIWMSTNFYVFYFVIASAIPPSTYCKIEEISYEDFINAYSSKIKLSLRVDIGECENRNVYLTWYGCFIGDIFVRLSRKGLHSIMYTTSNTFYKKKPFLMQNCLIIDSCVYTGDTIHRIWKCFFYQNYTTRPPPRLN